MSVLWVDTSGYNRSVRRIPNSFKVNVGVIIQVHRHVHYEKKDWLLTCTPFFDNKVISNGTLKDAINIAEKLVLAKLQTAITQLQILQGDK